MSHGWQAPFRVLREQFLAAAQRNFRVNLALASFPHHGAYRIWYQQTIEANLLREVTSPMNREPDTRTRECAIGFVWGEAEGVRRFDALARESGNLLPFDFHPGGRLFPWINELSNVNPGPVTLWSEFLFVARFTAFQVRDDWPVRGCRVARLDGDPFLVSATAIERCFLSPDAPALDVYFRTMRTVCPWMSNIVGGFPMTSPGILASPFLRFDLPAVFRIAVELGSMLATRDAMQANPASNNEAERASQFTDVLDADRSVEVAGERLLCLLNPRQCRLPDWSRQLDFADASGDARQALRTLGLAVADIRGDGEFESRGRELLSGGTRHLWSGMPPEDRTAVRDLLSETNRLWGWPTDPNGESGEYTGLRATLADPRVIDETRWQTRRPEYLEYLQTVTCHQNILVDTIGLPGGRRFDVYRDNVKGTRYSVPSVCPHADPQPPVELRPDGDLLAELECRFRDLGLIQPDQSIHWVGHQDRRETRCTCELAPGEFSDPRPPEWYTLRELKTAIVGMMRLVVPHVEGRKAGLVLPTQDLTVFDTIAVRVYGLAQSLAIPLPPVATTPNLPRAHAHGPVALPIHERPEGLIISEADGRQWLSNWRAVRVGIDAQLAQIDRAAFPGTSVCGVDTREYPLDAPAGTPSPLREAFDAVAMTLFEAADFRRQPWYGSQAFRALAQAFAERVQSAHRCYAVAELQLQAVVDADKPCAHQEALTAIRRVNDAAGHVVLGTIPDHMALTHLQQVPAPDVEGLLRRMRQQLSRAAQALSSIGASTAGRTPESAAIRRVRCEEADRSVYLDGKRITAELELALFRFFRAIAEVYPNAITFETIQGRTPGLHGKHPTRDLKNRLPPELARLVDSGKHGYFMKLPAPK